MAGRDGAGGAGRAGGRRARRAERPASAPARRGCRRRATRARRGRGSGAAAAPSRRGRLPRRAAPAPARAAAASGPTRSAPRARRPAPRSRPTFPHRTRREQAPSTPRQSAARARTFAPAEPAAAAIVPALDGQPLRPDGALDPNAPEERRDAVIARGRVADRAGGGDARGRLRLGHAPAGLRDRPPARGPVPPVPVRGRPRTLLERLNRSLWIMDGVLRFRIIRLQAGPAAPRRRRDHARPPGAARSASRATRRRGRPRRRRTRRRRATPAGRGCRAPPAEHADAAEHRRRRPPSRRAAAEGRRAPVSGAPSARRPAPRETPRRCRLLLRMSRPRRAEPLCTLDSTTAEPSGQEGSMLRWQQPTSTGSSSRATSRATPSCAQHRRRHVRLQPARRRQHPPQGRVSGEWVDKPNYFDVTVWGAQGENCAQYLAKGRPVAVDGRLDWREWEDKEGNKRQSVDIIADSVQFLGSREGGRERRPLHAAERRPRRHLGLPAGAGGRRGQRRTTTFRSDPGVESRQERQVAKQRGSRNSATASADAAR